MLQIKALEVTSVHFPQSLPIPMSEAQAPLRSTAGRKNPQQHTKGHLGKKLIYT